MVSVYQLYTLLYLVREFNTSVPTTEKHPILDLPILAQRSDRPAKFRNIAKTFMQ